MIAFIIDFLKQIGLIFDPSVAPDFSSGGEKFFISFEGLGIGQFRMNPVAIPIGNGIRWYGILITLGILFAFFYVKKRSGELGYKFDDLLDFVLIVVPVGVLGARLFYVFTAEGFDLKDWYKIWEGGLAIYGGIIAGAIALLAVGLYKKVRILRLMDCTVPGVMVAQAIGRWGNFCNGEAFGAETDSLLRMGLSLTKGGAQVYVHPTFLYESLWNVCGFLLINAFFKKRKFDGQITLEYIGWYGLGRFFIELLRQDSLPLQIGEYSFRISSVIGAICFIICLVLFLSFIFRKRSPLLDMPSYYGAVKPSPLEEKQVEQSTEQKVNPEESEDSEKAETDEGEKDHD